MRADFTTMSLSSLRPKPPPIRIVRNKRFEMPSLTPEDAAVRLELIDHAFFVFRNETSGDVSVIYRRRAARPETVELRLISHDQATGSALRLRAHRDELIALEQEMGPRLGLFSDGNLMSSPI